MGLWLSQFIRSSLLLLLGGLAGLALGAWLRAPLPGATLGALVGLGAALLPHARGGAALLKWLREDTPGNAPRDAGFWGELGYRMDRALRTRDRAVEAEKQRLTQFLSAIEASPNGVLLLDAADQVEWCNQQAAEHLGLDPLRDLRQRVTNLVRAPGFVGYLAAGPTKEPLVFSDPVGRRTLSVLLRHYGEGAKLVLTQDVTEAERNNIMRRDFVANVSHEIRTPLTVLAGFVESMGSLPLNEAERRRVLALMQQQTERMQALVADLLTLAQLEGSPRPAVDSWVAVHGLFLGAQAQGLALSSGRHEMSFDGGDDAEVAGSEAELASALVNLVSNAVRYTPAGGRIQVQWNWRMQGGAELTVRDNGIGIAREHMPRLTERFYRVDNSRARDTGGTGLGLSIVKHVIQRHSGEIEIESQPGQGSTFRLVFPPSRLRRMATQDSVATQG